MPTPRRSPRLANIAKRNSTASSKVTKGRKTKSSKPSKRTSEPNGKRSNVTVKKEMPATRRIKKEKESSDETSYSAGTHDWVRWAMHQFKRGELTVHGEVVTNPKQAIAIGLSKARKGGEKVPWGDEKWRHEDEYEKERQESVRDAMHKFKRGELTTMGHVVTDRKQAVAIGLSKARAHKREEAKQSKR